MVGLLINLYLFSIYTYNYCAAEIQSLFMIFLFAIFQENKRSVCRLTCHPEIKSTSNLHSATGMERQSNTAYTGHSSAHLSIKEISSTLLTKDIMKKSNNILKKCKSNYYNDGNWCSLVLVLFYLTNLQARPNKIR